MPAGKFAAAPGLGDHEKLWSPGDAFRPDGLAFPSVSILSRAATGSNRPRCGGYRDAPHSCLSQAASSTASIPNHSCRSSEPFTALSLASRRGVPCLAGPDIPLVRKKSSAVIATEYARRTCIAGLRGARLWRPGCLPTGSFRIFQVQILRLDALDAPVDFGAYSFQKNRSSVWSVSCLRRYKQRGREMTAKCDTVRSKKQARRRVACIRVWHRCRAIPRLGPGGLACGYNLERELPWI